MQYLKSTKASQTPTKATLMGIPSGRPGVVATLKIMRRLVNDGKKQIPIRQLALRIVKRNKNKDWRGEIKSVHDWVQRNIRYVRDIKGVETIQTPTKTLEIRQGDCDDHAVIVQALLNSIGHPGRFVAMGTRPGVFQHVYSESKIGGADNWLPIETTEPWPVGVAPPNQVEKVIVHI